MNTTAAPLPAVADEHYVVHLSPLDFELWDEQQKSAIYVEGGDLSHKLTLAIWNKDPKKREAVFDVLANDSPDLKELERLKTFEVLSALLAVRDEELKKKKTEELKKMPEAFDALAQLQELKKLSDKGLRIRLQELREEQRESQHKFFRGNHHLELRFPKGALSEKARTWMEGDLDRLLARKETLGEDVWYIHYHDHPARNFESLYLLFPTQKTLEAANVEVEKPALEIVLPHIAVDAGNDALVLPVELRPGPLAKGAADSNGVRGARICTVEVLSQLGQKYIPLHFDVVGSNTVLNDRVSETKLLLRITNVDREVSIPIYRKGNRQTRFILACEIADRGGHQEWALTDEQKKVTVQVKKVAGAGSAEPNPDDDNDWESDPIQASTNGRMAEWVIDGEMLGTDMLKPNGSVYLRLKVKTGLRSGPTDVHLYYRHIPGYWDGSRACTIQKSPLIFHRDQHPIFLEMNFDQFKKNFSGWNGLVVVETSSMYGGTLQLKDFAQKLRNDVKIAAVFTDQGQNCMYAIYDNGKLVEGSFSNLTIPTESKRSAELDKLVSKLESLLGFSPLWSPDDCVGIGTNQPASKLAVTDGLTIGGVWALEHKAPTNGLIVQGKVGIGTWDPKRPLHVGDKTIPSTGIVRLAHKTAGTAPSSREWDFGTGDGANFDNNDNFGFRDLSANRTVMVLSAKGNVGIGVVKEPSEKLEVNGRIKDQTGYVLPVGAIIAYGGVIKAGAIEPPDGWLLCNGDKLYLENEAYQALFEVIGKSFGSGWDRPRGKFFQLPDLRGRFLRGVDGGSGRDPDRDSRTGITKTDVGSVQEDAFKKHKHGFSTKGAGGFTVKIGHRKFSTGGEAGYVPWDADPKSSKDVHTESEHTHKINDDGDSETRPKNMYVNFIIKY